MLRPGGRLVAIGYYGRDDVAQLLEPEVVAATMDATQRRTGWWLRNGFKIKVVHARVDLSDPDLAHELLPRLYGDRGRAYLMAPAPPVAAPEPRPLPSWTGRGRRLRIGGASTTADEFRAQTALRTRFGADIIDRSEGQALLPPEPGLRRYPGLRTDRGGGIMAALTSSHCRRAREAANPLRSAGGVRRTDGDHAAHEDHLRHALGRQRGAPVVVRRRTRSVPAPTSAAPTR